MEVLKMTNLTKKEIEQTEEIILNAIYDLYFMTTGKRVTGLTYEKMEKVLKKELKYQIGLFKEAKRI